MPQTLTLPAYEDRTFDIIFDWTSYSTASQVPVQWLKYCIEMIPSDIRQRFMMAYILNPNNATHKYLRRLHNITAGAEPSTCLYVLLLSNNIIPGMNVSSSVKVCSSIAELRHFVPPTCVAPLVYASTCIIYLFESGSSHLVIYTAGLEQEECEQFQYVTMRQAHIRMSVTLEVGLTHLRITSVKPILAAHEV